MEVKDIISSGLLELYASGLASAEEARQVETYIARYPEVAAELSEIEKAMELYVQSQAVSPAGSVKDKIFSRINELPVAKVVPFTDAPVAAIRPMNNWWKIAAAASVALLIGSIIINVQLYQKQETAAKDLQAAKSSLVALQEKNNIIEEDMHVVQNKFSVPVSLKGLEAAPDAAAKIFWMQNTGEVYIDASNLPDAPAGKQYQLWGIVDGKPVDGGMILTSKKGDKFRIQKMKTFGKAEAFAVTLEKEKGNPTPEGPMFVMGKM